MRKKIITSLINLSICSVLLSCFNSSPVHATYPINMILRHQKLSEGEDGSCIWTDADMPDFVVVTDSDTLPDEITEQPWYGYNREWSHKDINSKYEEDVYIFGIMCKNDSENPFDLSDVNIWCRRTYLENKDILDTAILESDDFAKVTWNGDIICTFQDKALEQYGSADAIYTAYPEVFTDKGEVIALSEIFQNKNDLSDYALIISALDESIALLSKYSDIILDLQPDFQITAKEEATFTTYSAWEQIGDLSGDNTINSSDASEILVISAKIGAGNDDAISKEQKCYADINADGEANAEDANLILEYSASVGSGNFSGELSEFIRQKVS